MGPESLTTVSSLFIYLAFGLPRSFNKKNTWALFHELKLVPFSSCSCVIRNEWHQLHSVLFISVEYFCHEKLILSRRVLWNSHIKIIKLSVVLKIWDEWCNKWIITQGAGTLCFFRMLTTVFLSYLKTNFTLKCVQTSLTCISLCQKFLFISLLRLMIGINFYVLCCLGRYDVTPQYIVGTTDRMGMCNIYRA